MTVIVRRQLMPAKVRAARESAGWSAADAAAAAQLSKPAYYRWEDVLKGPLRSFDKDRAELLCAELGTTLDDLTEPLTSDLPAYVNPPQATATTPTEV